MNAAEERVAGAAAGPLAIVCGGGSIPLAVAAAVTARGRQPVMFALRGFADPAIERYPHHWVEIGQIGRFIRLIEDSGCREAVMIGSLVRPRLSRVRLDFTTIRMLPRIAGWFRGGDDRLLTGVGELFAEHGVRLLGAHEVAPEILLPAGIAGKVAPTAEEEADIARGFEVLRALGPFDVGQAVAIAGQRVLTIEAAEGTEEMLARVAAMRASGRLRLPPRAGVLVKAPKLGQSRRIDLPAMGADTVHQAKAAGLAGIAFEADSTVAPDVSVLVKAADAAGLFVIGVAAAEGSGQ